MISVPVDRKAPDPRYRLTGMDKELYETGTGFTITECHPLGIFETTRVREYTARKYRVTYYTIFDLTFHKD